MIKWFVRKLHATKEQEIKRKAIMSQVTNQYVSKAPVLAYMPTVQLRDACWKEIENVEHWARRLINEIMSENYGSDYFNYADGNGNRVIKSAIVRSVQIRMESDMRRFPRMVDALTLENVIDIICNANLYDLHFKDALKYAYPCGLDVAKYYMTAIKDIRNRYAHLNVISIRDAERAICYCHDFIDGLEKYYQEVGRGRDYNVPTFLKLTDSCGVVRNFSSGSGMLFNDNIFDGIRLRTGDIYRVEVEVDPTFDPSRFSLEWYCEWEYEEKYKRFRDTNCIDIHITNEMVGRSLKICCTLTTDKEWHRHGSYDDYFQYEIKTILPPIEDCY